MPTVKFNSVILGLRLRLCDGNVGERERERERLDFFAISDDPSRNDDDRERDVLRRFLDFLLNEPAMPRGFFFASREETESKKTQKRLSCAKESFPFDLDRTIFLDLLFSIIFWITGLLIFPNVMSQTKDFEL